jgi:glutamate--cysteine ligase catalytic subunit
LEGDETVHPSFKYGLIKLCEEYMDLKKWSDEHKVATSTYLEFLRRRSRGLIPTGAKFIRDFVTKHPAYKKDSIVSQEIAYDLISMIDKLESGSTNEGNDNLRSQLLGSK